MTTSPHTRVYREKVDRVSHSLLGPVVTGSTFVHQTMSRPWTGLWSTPIFTLVARPESPTSLDMETLLWYTRTMDHPYVVHCRRSK